MDMGRHEHGHGHRWRVPLEKAATEALLATHAAVICKHHQLTPVANINKTNAVLIRRVCRRALFF
jgi:hypothetical protein